MTLITVHSPDLVVKGKVGDHSVSELQLDTFVAAESVFWSQKLAPGWEEL